MDRMTFHGDHPIDLSHGLDRSKQVEEIRVEEGLGSVGVRGCPRTRKSRRQRCIEAGVDAVQDAGVCPLVPQPQRKRHMTCPPDIDISNATLSRSTASVLPAAPFESSTNDLELGTLGRGCVDGDVGSAPSGKVSQICGQTSSHEKPKRGSRNSFVVTSDVGIGLATMAAMKENEVALKTGNDKPIRRKRNRSGSSSVVTSTVGTGAASMAEMKENEVALTAGNDRLVRRKRSRTSSCLTTSVSLVDSGSQVGSSSQTLDTGVGSSHNDPGRRKRTRTTQRLAFFEDNVITSDPFNKPVRFRGYDIPVQTHHLLPKRSCCYCCASKFQFEPPGFCCSSGQVQLVLKSAHPQLQQLYCGDSELSDNFRRYIRIYNSSFAFTSMGVNLDQRLMQQNAGVYTFRVQGQLHHTIRPLVPLDGKPAALQLYFYDTAHEMEHRLQYSSNLLADVVCLLNDIMKANPYARFFKSLASISELSDLKVCLASDPLLDQRVYNVPSVSQVAAIWVENSEGDNGFERPILLHGQDNSRYPIHPNYACYDALQYPLLFARGEVGWHPNISRSVPYATEAPNLDTLACPTQVLASELAGANCSSKKGRISCREYYSFQFQIRDNEVNLLLLSGRLFQQFAVDMYVKIETSRLQYLQQNQVRIRSDLYQGLVDVFQSERPEGVHYGKRIVLPASFIGGPRDMKRRYLDAMALVKKYGKPDLFLTFTCNPNWVEIQNELRSFELAQNRPDLTARVFRAKLEELKNDLVKRKLFGPVAAYVYVVEFQKRGLPHAHFLVILKAGHKLVNCEKIDHFVCAELPDVSEQPRLHLLVKNHMLHGPCGVLNPKNVCMSKKGCCKNAFPKSFSENTSFGEDSFPTYRRRDDGSGVLVRGKTLNNQWVVPYNPFLLAKFDSHLNVEVCSSIKAVKYLYKYIYKGHDRIKFQVGCPDTSDLLDEIKNFQNARWISAPESMWRIFRFTLNEMEPAVYTLQVHLPGLHMVSYRDETDVGSVLRSEHSSKTMLTEFFALNRVDSQACSLLYKDFPEHFVWHTTGKYWSRRKSKRAIGRLVAVNPSEGERYYLRILLSHVKGAGSFEDLRTLGARLCDTFREACLVRGLIVDDNHYDLCFEEASFYGMPSQLRHLYVTLLLYCSLHSPLALWSRFKDDMCADFHCMGKSQSVAERLALADIQRLLQSSGKNISEFGFQGADGDLQFSDFDSNCIVDELSYVITESDSNMVTKLNSDQRAIFDRTICAVDSRSGALLFVDGPGGTGKSFLYKAILAHVRSRGLVALATASSGVAAGLLPGGKTAHNLFKIPLDITSSMQCNVSKQTTLSRLITMAAVIIWDEAPMMHRFCIEAVDRLLRDLNTCDTPFGGQIVVFGGDFRQILPVVPHADPLTIASAALVNSYLWSSFEKWRLTVNVRAQADSEYAEFLLRVGDGTEALNQELLMPFPFQLVIPYVDLTLSLDILIKLVFGDVSKWDANSSFNHTRVIITPKNDSVDLINNVLIDEVPGESKVYYSFDEPLCITDKSFQADFLNTLNVQGVPPHELRLKKNCPVILMRNINCAEGLSNGTRLLCHSFQPNLLECVFCDGAMKGRHVFLPRIPFVPLESQQNPFSFKRTQFPIRLCFAMTINKVQGQTLDFVGLFLPNPVFSHGQLYVALSRVQNRDSIKILICPHAQSDSVVATKNIVFTDVLALTGSSV